MSRSRKPTEIGGLALSGGLTLLGGLGLGLSFLLPREVLPGVEICVFRRWTGLPCPGCGLTRAFCAIGHGDLAAAWELNPFSFVFYAGCIVLLLRPLLNRLFPRAEPRIARSPWLVCGPLLLILAMWVFGIWRIVASLP